METVRMSRRMGSKEADENHLTSTAHRKRVGETSRYASLVGALEGMMPEPEKLWVGAKTIAECATHFGSLVKLLPAVSAHFCIFFLRYLPGYRVGFLCTAVGQGGRGGPLQ